MGDRDRKELASNAGRAMNEWKRNREQRSERVGDWSERKEEADENSKRTHALRGTNLIFDYIYLF